LLNSPALRLPARLRLAAFYRSVLAAHVVSTEEVHLDLDDRGVTARRMPAIHGAAGVRSAVKLGEEGAAREQSASNRLTGGGTLASMLTCHAAGRQHPC